MLITISNYHWSLVCDSKSTNGKQYERGSNSKITAIFQTQMLLLKNGITVYSRIVLLNRYRSALIAHAWLWQLEVS